MSTWSSRAAQQTQRRTTSRHRRPKLTKVSGAWGALTALFGLLAFTVQSVTLIVLAVVSLLGLIVTAFAGQSTAVPARRASTEKRGSAGGKPRKQRAAGNPGAPTKRRKCSSACRRSTKDPKTCNCSCRGKSHGSESGVSAPAPSSPKLPTRSQVRAKPMRVQEREVIRQQRKIP